MGRALGQVTRSGRSGEPRRELRILHVDGGKTTRFGGDEIPVQLPFSTRLDLSLEALRKGSPTGRVTDFGADYTADGIALGLASTFKGSKYKTE